MILVVSDRDYPSIGRVGRAIVARGGAWRHVRSWDFPLRTTLSLDPLSPRLGTLRLPGGELITLADVTALWIWKGVDHELPEGLAPAERQLLMAGASETLFSMIALLESRVRCVNSPSAVATGRVKARQLAEAVAVGFRCPATHIGNDPQAVAGLAREHGELIFKLANRDPRAEDDQQKLGVPTHLLTPEELSDLDGVGPSPGIFQEHVIKRFDLRIYVFGSEVHAFEIHSQVDARTRVDYREQFGLGVELVQQVHVLPDEVRARCREVVRRLGLRYAALDLILTPDGEYVFLEANYAGQFGWLENVTGVALSEAMARLLLGTDAG